LDGARSLERAMGEVTVVPSGDRKHADVIEGDGDGDGGPAPSYPQPSQTHQMHGNEWDTPNPVYLGRPFHFRVFKSCPGVKPAKKRIPKVLGFGRDHRLHIGHTIL